MKIQKSLLLAASMVLVLSACDNDDDADIDTDTGDVVTGEPAGPTVSGFDGVASNAANAESALIEPMSLQIELDQLSVNGRNGEPVPVQEGDTVASILARARNQ